MVIPIIKTKVDATQLENAINLANELIDKLEQVNTLATKLKELTDNMDLNISFPEKPEDS